MINPLALDPTSTAPILKDLDCSKPPVHAAFDELMVDISYYRRAAQLREELKSNLKSSYFLNNFDLYLTTNTTHGLMIASHALALIGCGFAMPTHSLAHYPPYAPLLQMLKSLPIRTGIARWTTHVSPLTGNSVVLEKEGADYLLVDAAQSFATFHHNALCSHADIFVTSLHKHARLAIGIGIIALRQGRIPHQVHEILSIAERGSHSLTSYKQALARLQQSQEKLFNKACMITTNAIKMPVGFELLTTDRRALFLCIRYPKPLTLPSEGIQGFTVKQFKDQRILRISAFIEGSANSPAKDVLDSNIAALQCWLDTLQGDI